MLLLGLWDCWRVLLYAGVQYYMNLVAIMVLIQPLIIVAFDLPIMPSNSPPSITRRYIILLVPYMVFARIASVMLSIRFPHSDSIMLRSEQVKPKCSSPWSPDTAPLLATPLWLSAP